MRPVSKMPPAALIVRTRVMPMPCARSNDLAFRGEPFGDPLRFAVVAHDLASASGFGSGLAPRFLRSQSMASVARRCSSSVVSGPSSRYRAARRRRAGA